MFVLKCVKPAYFDLDDTLIKWRPSENEREERGTDCEWSIKSLAMGEDGKLFIKEQVEEDSFIRLSANIEQLKEHKRRGHTVIVWSAGGDKWIETAIKMLGLEDYVDLGIEKPAFVYDDKAIEEFMPVAQFIKDEHYKQDSNKKMKKAASAEVSRAARNIGRALSNYIEPAQQEEDRWDPGETGPQDPTER